MNKIDILQKLEKNQSLSHNEWTELVLYNTISENEKKYIFSTSRQITDKIYGKKIFIRGLVEFSSYCKNDCFYCGLRCSNKKAERYRLTEKQIIMCCKQGYDLGLRSFVLQSGEDLYFDTDKLCNIIKEIKNSCPNSAVTLSIGEKSYNEYKAYKDAGTDRYLLRHETADNEHYSKLHPKNMLLSNRMECIKNLRDLKYQVGVGFIVNSPFQTSDSIAYDLEFIYNFKPEMVGIGPFIPQKDTPFSNMTIGSAEYTVYLLALIRIIHPHVLLPSTTALNSIDQNGRINGIKAGANVLMPNLSPTNVRKKYAIYDNKKADENESAENIKKLSQELKANGFELSMTRGDYK